MKYIIKNNANEPAALTLYRQTTENARYAGYIDNDINTGEERPLKRSLSNEQGWICCYCNRRISIDKITVEHYIPQSRHDTSPYTIAYHRANELIYNNMLASCNSNERKCSEIRKNIPLLQVDPRNFNRSEGPIKYTKQGEIFCDNIDMQNEIKNILRLNTDQLIKNRGKFIEEVYLRLNKEGWSIRNIQREIDRLTTLQNGKYQEYCMAPVYHLRKKLRSMQ